MKTSPEVSPAMGTCTHVDAHMRARALRPLQTFRHSYIQEIMGKWEHEMERMAKWLDNPVGTASLLHKDIVQAQHLHEFQIASISISQDVFDELGKA